MLNELNMSTNEYNWVQSIYFISYIVFEVPSNLLQKRLTPRLWQSRIMLTWGIVLACHAAVQNKQALYALRFILGMCEAGMFPGIAAQLCGWYRSDEMGLPIMWMFGFQNTSGIIGSLITYAISYMNGMRGLSAWRWYVSLDLSGSEADEIGFISSKGSLRCYSPASSSSFYRTGPSRRGQGNGCQKGSRSTWKHGYRRTRPGRRTQTSRWARWLTRSKTRRHTRS